MVDQRISELTDGGSFAAGDEFVINRGGANRRVQVSAGDPKLDSYATTAQAVAGAATGAFMDPVLTKNAIQTFAITSAGFATTAQATAGTSDGAIMTPSATKSAIENFALTSAAAATTAQATAATSNGTFMTPVVTDKFVRSIAFTGATSFATTSQATDGTNDSTVMNPVLVRNAIEAIGNPGTLTSANAATTAQATAANSDGTFMTPINTLKSIQSYAFTSANYATTAQAEAGLNATTIVSPVLVKNAIAALGNSGTFTTANAATTAQATAGTSNGTFVTPVNAVKIAEDAAQAALPNTFATISVSGEVNVSAAQTNDTVEFEAGTNVTITTSGKTITFAASAAAGGGGLSDVKDDTNPELGGYLAFGAFGYTVGCTAGSVELKPRDICLVTTSGVSPANASSEATTGGMMVMALTTVAASTSANFLARGVYTTSALSRGDLLYLGLTNATFTTTRPSTTAQQVRIIGHSLSPTELYFDPDNTWIEIG